MSYDLVFWRHRPGITPPEPGDVYEGLCEGRTMDDLLEPVPREAVLEAVQAQFGDRFDREEQDLWMDKDGGFQVECHPTGILFLMGHRLSTDIYNEVIDVMATFGCPLYDPQTETRYRLPETPQ